MDHEHNNLDLDQLLSGTSTPKKSIRRSWRKRLPAILAAAAVVLAGFAGGFWGYFHFTADDAEPTAYPQQIRYLDTELVYEDSVMSCYMYREPLGEFYYSEDNVSWESAFQDGDNIYILDGYPAEFGDVLTGYSYYNFWLRLELTAAGKVKYDRPDMLRLLSDDFGEFVADLDDVWLGTTAYYDTEGNLDGWFVYGHLCRQTRLLLERYGAENTYPLAFMLDAVPVFSMGNVGGRTTYELADFVLNHTKMWNHNLQKMPENFEDYPALLALSRRSDCIDALLEFLSVGDERIHERAITVLESSPFRELMTQEQQAKYTELTEVYFKTEVYSYPLTEVTRSNSQTPFTKTFFDDVYRLYPVSEETPQTLPEDVKINFYARVDLTEYFKSQYNESWELKVLFSFADKDIGAQTVLGVREYYDGDGNVAGWFVYGQVPQEVQATFSLGFAQGGYAQIVTLTPIPEDAQAPEVLYG